MSEHVVSYLKVVALGVAAFILSACARLGSSGGYALMDARYSDPPASRDAASGENAVESDAERVEALEQALVALDADIVELRRALALMGPLPEQSEYFLPEAPAAGGEHPQASMARLYAVAPELTHARSLFFEAELSVHPTRAAAEASWRKIAGTPGLAGLFPRYRADDSIVRLTVGPLASDAAVDALCVELSALNGPCQGIAPIRAYR